MFINIASIPIIPISFKILIHILWGIPRDAVKKKSRSPILVIL